MFPRFWVIFGWVNAIHYCQEYDIAPCNPVCFLAPMASMGDCHQPKRAQFQDFLLKVG